MSYITELETVTDEVAVWAAERIQTVIKILAPDGESFLQDEKPDEQKLQEYLEVRGSPDAWLEWINATESRIIQQLLEKGLQESDIGSVNPRDIATSFAIKWSVDSEELIHGDA